MTQVFFCSDLHLGHDRIITFSDKRKFKDIKEHDKYIMDEWESKVTKRDLVYVCGDLGFEHMLPAYGDLPGTKILVKGNHDPESAETYLKYFKDIQAIFKYKGYWVSHCPMHPQELWGRRNIHGHVHNHTVLTPTGGIDDRYINLCMENRERMGGHTIIPFDFIKENWHCRLK